MADTSANLVGDIEEIKGLILSVKSPRIKELLEAKLTSWEANVEEQSKPEEKDSDTGANGDNEPDVTPPPAQNPPEPEYKVNDSPPTVNGSLEYIPIESFGWDQGSYGSDKVSVYITKGMEGIGQFKKNVECSFTKGGLNLTVKDFNGKNYRLVIDNLEHDIVPEQSKVLVKANKILLKLMKVKGEYSYDHWTELRSKKSKDEKSKLKNDPTSGIMDMMKKMYDEGDDTMKKTIGEAMMKSQQKQANPGLDDDFGM
jgi:calcyclin binding protein